MDSTASTLPALASTSGLHYILAIASTASTLLAASIGIHPTSNGLHYILAMAFTASTLLALASTPLAMASTTY